MWDEKWPFVLLATPGGAIPYSSSLYRNAEQQWMLLRFFL
jgi:hypothetical protein